MKRAFTIVLTSVVALAITWTGAGSSSAQPQLPKFTTIGEDFGTFGDHAYCRGAVNLKMFAPKRKRGVVRVSLTSHGFTGDGSSWTRNPRCRVLLVINQTSGNSFMKQTPILAAFGPRAGQNVTRDIVTGSGVALVSVIPYTVGLPRVAQGNGTGAYVLVP